MAPIQTVGIAFPWYCHRLLPHDVHGSKFNSHFGPKKAKHPPLKAFDVLVDIPVNETGASLGFHLDDSALCHDWAGQC